MACEQHKVRTDDVIAVSRLAGTHIDSKESLIKFLMKHRDCNLRFFSEYDEERCAYENDVEAEIAAIIREES